MNVVGRFLAGPLFPHTAPSARLPQAAPDIPARDKYGRICLTNNATELAKGQNRNPPRWAGTRDRFVTPVRSRPLPGVDET